MSENPQLTEEETQAQRGRATDSCHRVKGKARGVGFENASKKYLAMERKMRPALELSTFAVVLIYDAFVGDQRAGPMFA